jgi:hypothetical protein
MHIFDFRNLVDEELLWRALKHHPLHHDLASELRSLTIEEKTGPNVGVEMDEQRHATLYIHPIIRPSERDRFILYHELGHLADRINPRFGYRHRDRMQLDAQQEKNFVELWNVYIDARLNQYGLFCLPQSGQSEFIIDGRRYVLPKNEINTYLLEAITHLTQRGMYRPGCLVSTIWNNPHRFLGFDDLLDAVR